MSRQQTWDAFIRIHNAKNSHGVTGNPTLANIAHSSSTSISPPDYSPRHVPTGTVVVEMGPGSDGEAVASVPLELTGNVHPTGGEWTINEVTMQGRSVYTTAGEVQLRHMLVPFVIDHVDDGTDITLARNFLNWIQFYRIAVRVYGNQVPWTAAAHAWQIDGAVQWDTADDKEVWQGDNLVRLSGTIDFVQYNPVPLLTVQPGQPGSAARRASKKAKAAKAAKKKK